MKRLIYVSLIVVLVLSIALCAFACKDKTPANKFDSTKEYQSETIKFWIGIGKAYATVKEGKFDVWVSVSGGEFESWLQGDCTYDEANDSLVITATWEDKGDDTTKLTSAESGQAMTYAFENGICKIAVDIPSAGSKTFEIVC